MRRAHWLCLALGITQHTVAGAQESAQPVARIAVGAGGVMTAGDLFSLRPAGHASVRTPWLVRGMRVTAGAQLGLGRYSNGTRPRCVNLFALAAPCPRVTARMAMHGASVVLERQMRPADSWWKPYVIAGAQASYGTVTRVRRQTLPANQCVLLLWCTPDTDVTEITKSRATLWDVGPAAGAGIDLHLRGVRLNGEVRGSHGLVGNVVPVAVAVGLSLGS